jgi:hypothetical protein
VSVLKPLAAAMRAADQMAAAVTRAGTQASWVDDDLT